jgi:hypothetical protein
VHRYDGTRKWARRRERGLSPLLLGRQAHADSVHPGAGIV